MGYTLEFRDFASGTSLSSAFNQTPEAAVSFFKDKGLKPTFSYADMIAEEHVAAFTVAKMMDVDLLADVSKALDNAIANGETVDEFRKKLTPELQKKGWWGKADVTDPATGTKSTAQLGSAHRLDTIYRSNVQAAYSAGQWDTIQGQQEDAPWLMYDAVDDHRTRPKHARWDNTVLRADDPWWDTHYPINGYNCRCGVIQLDDDQLEALGVTPSKQAPPLNTRPWTNPKTGEVEQVPDGIDPGWHHHIGKARQAHLEQVLQEKIGTLPASLQAAAPAVQELADKAWTKGHKIADEQLANITPAAVAAKRLQEIEANNEPYLASALKAVNKTKQSNDMDPVEKLAAVEAKAAKAEQSQYVSEYKKAKLAGKAPGAKAQAAFDALPDEAQADIDAGITDQLQQAAKLQEAEDTLAKIEAGGEGIPPFKTQELAKMKAAGEADGMHPPDLVDELDNRYLAHTAKKQKASALSGYKKKILAGKIPTPTQKAAFDALEEGEAEEFLAKIGAAKTNQLQQAADAGDPDAQVQLIANQATAELPPGPVEAAIKQLADAKTLDDDLIDDLASADFTPAQSNQVLDWAQEAANAKGNGTATAKIIKDEFDYTPTDAPDIAPAPTQAATGPSLSTEKLDTDIDDVVNDLLAAELPITENSQKDIAATFKWWINPDAFDKPNGTGLSVLKVADYKVLEDTLQEVANLAAKHGTQQKFADALAKNKIPTPGVQFKGLQGAHPEADPDAPVAPAASVEEQMDEAVLKATDGDIVSLDVEGGIAQIANYVVSPTAPQPDFGTLMWAGDLPDDRRHTLWGDLLTIAKAQGNYYQAKAKIEEIDKVPDAFDPGPPIAAAQNAPEPPTPSHVVPDSPINPEALTKVGGQEGSNSGGTYQDTDTGLKWYIKQPDSEDNARNEVLAGKLYAAAGVEVPRIQMVDVKGQRSIASQIIEGLEQGGPGSEWRSVEGAHSNYVVDAWLANWDVVGMEYDNLFMKAGRAVRVDPGGALRYRAQGGLKSDSAFGNTVSEIESLRDAGTNAQSANVFKDLSREDMIAGARKVARMTDEKIDELIAQHGPLDAKAAQTLSAKLKARRDDILERFPEARTRPDAVDAPDSSGKLLTDTEQGEIVEARSNGITRPTDGADVEDQQMLMWRELDPQGNPVTAASVRARPGSRWARNLNKSTENVAGVGEGPKAPKTNAVDQGMLDAVKGINANPVIRQKDVDRVADVRTRFDSLVRELDEAVSESRITKATRDKVAAHYQQWLDTLENAVAEGVGGAAKQTAEKFQGFGTISVRKAKPKADTGEGIQWRRTEGLYPAYTTERGMLKRKTGGRVTFTGKDTTRFKGEKGDWEYYLEAEVDGVRVRYYPDSPDISLALRNRIDVYADGDTEDAAERINQALQTLGLDTRRSTADDTRERFYGQLAKARGIERGLIEQSLDRQTQPDRIAALRETLRQDMTAEQFAKIDSAGAPEYPPFGQARPEYMRTDLDDAKGRQWQKGNRFVHESRSPVDMFKNLISEGGYFHAKSDFFRRGKDFTEFGMSPDVDMARGGGNYVYTKAKTTGTADKSTGLTWSGDMIRRVDARGHKGDPIGEIGDNIRTHLRDGPGLTGQRANSHYEWIFKHGVSLYSHGFRLQLPTRGQVDEVIQWLRQQGEPFASNQWPDGRSLEEVIVVTS